MEKKNGKTIQNIPYKDVIRKDKLKWEERRKYLN